MLKELSKVEQRYDALMAVIRDGMAVTEVAAKFGVHRDTLYAWLARYEAEGLEGLAERSHRPRRSPAQMAAPVEARVLEVWDGNELVKTVLRTSKGVVRKKKAEYHHWH